MNEIQERLEIFEYILWDQDYESILLSNSRRASIHQYLALNYHFVGFWKKLILFIIFLCLNDNLEAIFGLILTILSCLFILNVILRTHRLPILNFLKSLNDLILVAYFTALYLINKEMRALDDKSDEYLSSLTDEDIQ